MKTKNIKKQLDDLLNLSEEQQLEHDAQILAFQFLNKVDKTMADTGMSKKQLAEKIGTSAAFITQLFRGDRKPNWNILAKMQKELSLDFKIITEKELDGLTGENMINYHRNWAKSKEHQKKKDLTSLPEVIMHIEENKNPPLAG